MNLWRQRIKKFSSKSDFRAWEKQMLTHKSKKKKKMGRNYKDKDFRYQCIPDSKIIQIV